MSARWVSGIDETLGLARLLSAAVLAHARAQRYQAELGMWPGTDAGVFGIEAATSQDELAAWIADEAVLVPATTGDRP